MYLPWCLCSWSHCVRNDFPLFFLNNTYEPGIHLPWMTRLIENKNERIGSKLLAQCICAEKSAGLAKRNCTKKKNTWQRWIISELYSIREKSDKYITCVCIVIKDNELRSCVLRCRVYMYIHIYIDTVVCMIFLFYIFVQHIVETMRAIRLESLCILRFSWYGLFFNLFRFHSFERTLISSETLRDAYCRSFHSSC